MARYPESRSQPCALRRFVGKLFSCCKSSDMPLESPAWTPSDTYKYPAEYKDVYSPDVRTDYLPSTSEIFGTCTWEMPPLIAFADHSDDFLRVTNSPFRPAYCLPTPTPYTPILPHQFATPEVLCMYPAGGDSDEMLQELSQIPPDTIHWETSFGELSLTPNELGKAMIPPGLPIPTHVRPTSTHSLRSCTPHAQICSPHPEFYSNIVLDRWLSVNLHYYPRPQIEWDIVMSPGWARDIYNDAGFQQSLYRAATLPGKTRMKIHFNPPQHSDFYWMWNSIKIDAVAVIRVGDVLHAIYNYFRMPMAYGEVQATKARGRIHYRVLTQAFEARVGRKPSQRLRHEEHMGGFRRVDCLGTMTTFWGMWVSDSDICLGLVDGY